jgi:hypothetical protein
MAKEDNSITANKTQKITHYCGGMVEGGDGKHQQHGMKVQTKQGVAPERRFNKGHDDQDLKRV